MLLCARIAHILNTDVKLYIDEEAAVWYVHTVRLNE